MINIYYPLPASPVFINRKQGRGSLLNIFYMKVLKKVMYLVRFTLKVRCIFQCDSILSAMNLTGA